MSGIIDFHSHILPGIDDGSGSVEESAAMLRQEAAQGINHVIATPHFYARYDDPAVFLEARAQAERQGLIPVVAHVDRYISPLRTYGIPDRLAQLPVLVQANAGFFLRGSTRSLALKLLRQDKIHLLGSDCHNLTTRPPLLGDAVEVIRKKLGEEPLERIRYYQKELLTE